MSGHGGRDLLVGGTSRDAEDRDTLFGGAGNDSLIGAARSECGPGEDSTSPSDVRFDFPSAPPRRFVPSFVRGDCEGLSLADLSAALRLLAPPTFLAGQELQLHLGSLHRAL